jgi:cell wall-associated NlpC family hydrolase
MAGAVVTVCTSLLGAGTRPAGADPLASAKAQAARITAQLAADQQRLDAIAEQYDGAGQKVQQVGQQITQIKSTIAQDRSQVAAAQTSLRQEAVSSYMTGTPDSDLQTLFGTGGEQATVAGEYRSVASGNISGAIDSLNVAQTHLATQEDQLQVAQTQAQAALTQAANARKAAQAIVADQEATLAKVKGQIGSLVAQRQAAQQAAAHAAFLARIQPATKANHGDVITTAAVLPDLPAAGGAAGALAAAESQIGVPYRWGGESPGGGFDCSGLTQWAWRQAGVGLPRTAAAQYGAIAHVSLSALQPGDLVFWGHGGIDHVGLYVGGGNVIHAPQTGSRVSIQPIWNNGLVGAGRP